jgi:hypothetical protein
MTYTQDRVLSSLFVPGEVLALLSPMQELEPGLYLVDTISDGWAMLREVIDDEVNEQLLVTNRQKMLPVLLLELFMPVGLRLSANA